MYPSLSTRHSTCSWNRYLLSVSVNNSSPLLSPFPLQVLGIHVRGTAVHSAWRLIISSPSVSHKASCLPPPQVRMSAAMRKGFPYLGRHSYLAAATILVTSGFVLLPPTQSGVNVHWQATESLICRLVNARRRTSRQIRLIVGTEDILGISEHVNAVAAGTTPHHDCSGCSRISKL